jgi:hypothetical protein
MKYLGILSIVIVIVITSVCLKTRGQSFEPILKNTASFFVDSDGDIKAVRIDSLSGTEDSIIFYYNREWNFDDFQCIKPNGPSWLGLNCILQDSAKYLFFNKLNDTITLLPNEELNRSWIFYKFNEDSIIQSKIIARENYSFLGLTDTVEKISFQLTNKSGDLISNPINQTEIKISKNYGYISMFSIPNFPDEIVMYSLIGLTNPIIGKTFLTQRKIYNFNINDEFHYDDASSSPPNGSGRFSKVIKKIIGKYISSNTDTMIYTINRTTKTELLDWQTHTELNSFVVDTVEEKYVFAPENQYLPGQPIFDEQTFYRSYGLWLSKSNNNRLILSPSSDFLSKGDSCCWDFIFYDPVGYISYMEGCGLFQRDNDNFPGMSHETMVYYKKSDEEWGTPYILNSKIEHEFIPLKIYPNPIIDDEFLTIDLSNPGVYRIQLIDLMGKGKYQLYDLHSGKKKLDVSFLEKGLYFLKITDNSNNAQIFKLIKK